jgi:hypothetical protein
MNEGRLFIRGEICVLLRIIPFLRRTIDINAKVGSDDEPRGSAGTDDQLQKNAASNPFARANRSRTPLPPIFILRNAVGNFLDNRA